MNTPKTTEDELKDWRRICVQNSRKSYQEYLSTYPEGQFTAQAKRFLKWFDEMDHSNLAPRNSPAGWGIWVVGFLILGAGLLIGYFLLG